MNNKNLYSSDKAFNPIFNAENKSEWGALINQKPTAVAREIIKNGVDISVVKEHLMKDFFVSEQYANLVYQTIKSQKTIIRNDNLINLSLNFPSLEKEEVFDFLETLKKEISLAKEQIFQKSYVVRSIYISGDMLGTLNTKEIDALLAEIAYPVSEFTVETDKIDSITEDKLLVLKNHGITRLVLNPQTFVVKTLKTLKNKQTNNQVFEAYMLALKHNFLVDINFVAGLENETLTNFKKTISTTLELSPHNITIKTLPLKVENKKQLQETKIMMDYALKTLLKAGYKPYYFIKKDNSDYLEKIGFAIEGKVSLFNIDKAENTLLIKAIYWNFS